MAKYSKHMAMIAAAWVGCWMLFLFLTLLVVPNAEQLGHFFFVLYVLGAMLCVLMFSSPYVLFQTVIALFVESRRTKGRFWRAAFLIGLAGAAVEFALAAAIVYIYEYTEHYYSFEDTPLDWTINLYSRGFCFLYLYLHIATFIFGRANRIHFYLAHFAALTIAFPIPIFWTLKDIRL